MPAAPPSPDNVAAWELFKVEPRWLFLKVTTEGGLVGWGEPNLEGFSDTVAACVEELMGSVAGQDSARIQHIWQKLYRQKFYAGGPVFMSALSGIDQALWDIHGKRLGVNVSSLLGGTVRTRLKMYRWCGGDDNTPEEAAREAAQIIQSGSNFKLLKMNATPRMGYIDDTGIREAVSRMAAVRKAVGPDIGIGLDFHGRVKAPMAKKLAKALEPFDPLFYEEPVVKGQNAVLRGLSAATHIPLATGERMYTVEEFRDLLEQRSVGIIQPDVSHCGGVSSLLSISRLAEAYEVALAPHCPLGPIALASCLVVDAVSVNFAFQESSIGIHYNSEGSAPIDPLHYISNPEDFALGDDGCMAALHRPGLGVVIDEAKVRAAAAKGHAWRDREWCLADGCPTTW